jgi:LacI family transcriptional regulator
MAATLKDIARVTGLSLATLSKYLNGGNVLDKNRAAIETAIETLGYQVNTMARSLKTRRSMTVGVLIPDLENAFSTSIVSSLENRLLQAGYSTLICDYRQSEQLEQEKFDFLAERQIDGLVMMPLGGCADRLSHLQSRQVPVVLIDRPVRGCTCDVVLINNRAAACAAVSRLLQAGHRRIGIVSGPRGIHTADERLQGYHEALLAAGLAIDDDLVREGRYDAESGYHQTLALLQVTPSPTALFVTNHEMTFGSILALQARSISIPDQLSVIGFDNQILAKVLKPPLSIVLQPIRQIGETAAEILLERMQGRQGQPEIRLLAAAFIEGGSVAAPSET